MPDGATLRKSLCLLYYITDRKAFPGDETSRCRKLLEKIGEAASAGIDYVQLREKDLSTCDLEALAREALTAIQRHSAGKTALLVNSRSDVALAVGAAGVHLRGEDILPNDVRKVWELARESRDNTTATPIISVACHSPEDVTRAAANGASLALFAPVFEKVSSEKVAPQAAAGLDALRQAATVSIPVLALGGVTMQNARECLDAGASGIAAIRLFQENDVRKVVAEIRATIKR